VIVDGYRRVSRGGFELCSNDPTHVFGMNGALDLLLGFDVWATRPTEQLWLREN
jgi:hypothetical protein